MTNNLKPINTALLLAGFAACTVRADILAPISPPLNPDAITATLDLPNTLGTRSDLTTLLLPTDSTLIASGNGGSLSNPNPPPDGSGGPISNPPPPPDGSGGPISNPPPPPGGIGGPISIPPTPPGGSGGPISNPAPPPPPTGIPSGNKTPSVLPTSHSETPDPPAYTAIIAVGQDATGSSGYHPDFTSITAALDSVPSAIYDGQSCAARYLVKVMPGTYAERVTMKPCVDIEGWGEAFTKIATDDSFLDPTAVVGASHAELRHLTVESSSQHNNATAISNGFGQSPTLTQVTAIARSTGSAFAIVNKQSSPTLNNVTAIAMATARAIGISNQSSTPTMLNVIASASGSSRYQGMISDYLVAMVYNAGIDNIDSTVTMDHVVATAVDGIGLFNGGSSTSVLQNSILRGKPALSNLGTIQITTSRLDGGILPISNVNTNCDNDSYTYDWYGSPGGNYTALFCAGQTPPPAPDSDSDKVQSTSY